MFDTLMPRAKLLAEAQMHEKAAVAAGQAGDPLDLMRHHAWAAEELRQAALDLDTTPAWAAEDVARRMIAAVELHLRDLTEPAEVDGPEPW